VACDIHLRAQSNISHPRSFTMADSSETRVARATKPVSEALLNEKV
jgi:hypothetical protein